MFTSSGVYIPIFVQVVLERFCIPTIDDYAHVFKIRTSKPTNHLTSLPYMYTFSHEVRRSSSTGNAIDLVILLRVVCDPSIEKCQCRRQ
jgi:hypothetical protein